MTPTAACRFFILFNNTSGPYNFCFWDFGTAGQFRIKDKFSHTERIIFVCSVGASSTCSLKIFLKHNLQQLLKKLWSAATDEYCSVVHTPNWLQTNKVETGHTRAKSPKRVPGSRIKVARLGFP